MEYLQTPILNNKGIIIQINITLIIPIIREIESKKESSLILWGAFDIFVAYMPKKPKICAYIHKKRCIFAVMYDHLSHPHVVNNVVRRHIQISVYSQTQETIYLDEWQAGCGCGCNR